MKYALLIALLFSSSSFALRDVELTDQCKEELKERALKMETHRLTSAHEVLASSLEAEVTSIYWPAQDDIHVWVLVEDRVDGRSASYGAKVLKTEALKCNIPIVLDASLTCRFSVVDGPESLSEIPGVIFKYGAELKPDSNLTDLEENQIREFLSDFGTDLEIPQLIDETQDHELISGAVTLPNDRVLTYYGAYGGDNPYGIFFEKGTTTVAGQNGDESICIKY